MLGLFILAVIVAVVLVIWDASKKRKALESSVKERLGSIPGFTLSQVYLGVAGATGFAVDERNRKACMIWRKNKEIEHRVIPSSDLVSSESCENGETITKTSRGSQAGGVLVGGVLLGGVGAVIGGLSGKTKSVQKVTQLSLRVVVNNLGAPVHEVVFLNAGSSKDGFLYKAAEKEAYHWHSVISVLIKQADADGKTSDKARVTGSVADELAKLAQLKKDGAITQSEYDKQKAKLLA